MKVNSKNNLYLVSFSYYNEATTILTIYSVITEKSCENRTDTGKGSRHCQELLNVPVETSVLSNAGMKNLLKVIATITKYHP